jgi:hypothetical protein
VVDFGCAGLRILLDKTDSKIAAVVNCNRHNVIGKGSTVSTCFEVTTANTEEAYHIRVYNTIFTIPPCMIAPELKLMPLLEEQKIETPFTSYDQS